MDSISNLKGENSGRIRSWGMFSGSQHFGVKGHARALGWGLRRVTSKSITHVDLHKLNNKLVNA
jgi:hypothetical protein